MKKEIKKRITQITVLPEGHPIFSGLATIISVENEGGGDFVSVAQYRNGDSTGVNIDAHEWPVIREVIDGMFSDIAVNKE